MKLGYFTLLCPAPIQLSIGRIKPPKLYEIGELGYDRFRMYQVYLGLTAENYYKYLDKEQYESFWENMPDDQKDDFTLYDVILLEEPLRNMFVEIFNFFFIERVIFKDNLFFILGVENSDISDDDIDIEDDIVIGIINPQTFKDVVSIIQQICCIEKDDILDDEKPKFKNAKARKIYEKMKSAKKKEDDKKKEKMFLNMSLPNLISATAAKITGLNIVNIWDATLFQVYDQFRREQSGDAYYINSLRVAVWGDEENKFDSSLWYTNTFEKQ